MPQVLAGWLAAMGAKVDFCSQTAKDCAYERLPLPELLARSDIVSLHVPLNESTQGLMGAASFARMKRGAILVNVGAMPRAGGGKRAAALGRGSVDESGGLTNATGRR